MPYVDLIKRVRAEIVKYVDPVPEGPVSNPLDAKSMAFWADNGYLVLPGFFSSAEIEPVAELVERLWVERQKLAAPLAIDVFIGTPREKRILFRDAPAEAKQRPYKLNDLYLEYPVVRDTVLHPRLVAVLNQLLEGDPLVCNSLCFERGSQQRGHFDTFYMPPPVRNRMCATWIALEDAAPESGPLFYYPGSHQLTPFRFSNGALQPVPGEMPHFDEYIAKLLQDTRLEQERFVARKGDVFIWHAQLFHGGCAIDDMDRTRRSIVTHYFRAKDFGRHRVSTIGTGRHYLKRSHPLG